MLKHVATYIFVRVAILFIVICSIMLLTRCTTPIQDAGVPYANPLVEAPVLKANLQFWIDNNSYVGATVAQRQAKSVIKFNPPSETSLILISTCGRQKDFWYPDTKKPFIYDYIPMYDVENRGACPLYITAVTTKGEWYRGIIDWTNATAAKDAKVSVGCDGDWVDSVGNYICNISFGIPVYIKTQVKAVIGRDTETTCPEPVYEGLPTDQWRIPTRAPKKDESGLCVYVLVNKNREEFRLSVHAYTSILKVYPASK
jgi:hypothetical protein